MCTFPCVYTKNNHVNVREALSTSKQYVLYGLLTLLNVWANFDRQCEENAQYQFTTMRKEIFLENAAIKSTTYCSSFSCLLGS